MTNQELYNKIQRDASNFQIGFHQISLYKYFDIVERGGARAVDFKVDGENVTEKEVANRILQKGFQVWDRGIGLTSTSFFPKSLTPDSFNYKYYSKDIHVFNVVFAVPYCIEYERKPYFIGNLSMSFSFGNRLLLNDGIIPEFIYGYYEKSTPVTYTPFAKYHFSDELEFYQNERFWLNLSVAEQKQVLQKLFSEKKKAYQTLRLINSHRQIPLLMYNGLDRLIIRETRKQKKIYQKEMKQPNIFL